MCVCALVCSSSSRLHVFFVASIRLHVFFRGLYSFATLGHFLAQGRLGSLRLAGAGSKLQEHTQILKLHKKCTRESIIRVPDLSSVPGMLVSPFWWIFDQETDPNLAIFRPRLRRGRKSGGAASCQQGLNNILGKHKNQPITQTNFE